MEDNYKFKFSIVSAVYNVEQYLDEMIKSILKQSIGFKENIQLILVDDCSTDHSYEICKKYQEKYPNNIIVCKTESNSRQAIARNIGLQFVEGKYINFCDPDDILDRYTLKKVYNFFEKHYEEIDIVSIPMVFFGNLKGEHPLNDKFKKGTRIIDLEKEPNIVQMSIATAFIKNDICKNIVNFDKNLYHAEDAKEILKILDIKRKLGVVHDCIYWYRKHNNGTIAKRDSEKDSYLTYIEHFQEDSINWLKEKYKKVPLFAQYMLMYDMQSKISYNKSAEEMLNEEELTTYVNKILSVVENFDRDVILKQKLMPWEIRHFLVTSRLKDAKSDLLKSRHENGHLFNRVVVDFVDFKGSQVTFKFHYNLNPIYKNYILSAIINRRNQPIKITEVKPFYILGKICIYNSIYCETTFDYTKRPCSKLSFFLTYLGVQKKINSIAFTKWTPLNGALKKSYFIFGNYKMKLFDSAILIKKKKFLDHIGSEIKLTYHLLKAKQNNKFKIIIIRWLYLFLYPFMHKKDIWLFADKADKADDNGEALFKYVNKHKTNQKTYFLINRKYPDYKRMKKYGKVVEYMSIKHYILFLFSSFNISAYSHKEFINPFCSYERFFRDISFDKNFIFLQHGVITANLSNILNRHLINPRYFVTSTEAEFQNVNNGYDYNKGQVVLTGLPRYDYLHDDNKKIITIAPTWRSYHFAGMDMKTSRRILRDDFETTKFYKSICNLLNSRTLNRCCEKYGYTLQFLPHSIFFPYIDRFKINHRVKVLGYDNINYNRMFAESSLIVTDYSSLVFDFAYLKKPVVYYQFDKKENGYHYNIEDADFERDGFGEVAYEHNDVVRILCEYIKNDCKMKEKYQKRVETTFRYTDKNNCQRIYEKIIEIDPKYKPKKK